MIKKKKLNIAIIGLGNIGVYLYAYLNKFKNQLQQKTNINLKIAYISAKNKNKKRNFKIDKKIFYTNPLNIFNLAVNVLYFPLWIITIF